MSSVLRPRAPCAGVWLDQAGATIVVLNVGHDPLVQHVESDVESHFRLSGGWKAGMQTQDVADEKRIDRRRRQQLERYYEQVIASLGDAERVLIMGAGEAKLGLERVLWKRRSQRARRVAVRTADKMTERQLVAAVKRFFGDG